MGEPTMLEQLLQAMEQTKTVIRQAHEATSDLKQATKEAREVGRQLQHDEFEPWLHGEVQTQAETLAEGFKEVAEVYSDRIMKRFDRLANLLMYGNEQGRGDGLEPKIRKAAHDRHANGGGS
jgi:hypothetical protein